MSKNLGEALFSMQTWLILSRPMRFTLGLKGCKGSLHYQGFIGPLTVAKRTKALPATIYPQAAAS